MRRIILASLILFLVSCSSQTSQQTADWGKQDELVNWGENDEPVNRLVDFEGTTQENKKELIDLGPVPAFESPKQPRALIVVIIGSPMV